MASRSLIDLDQTFLPIAQMRQIARVTSLGASGLAGEIDLGEEHWVFAQHFPGDPIFPGCLLIEAAGQLVALWAWSQGERGRPRLVRTNAEFHAPVGAGSTVVRLEAEVRTRHRFYFGRVQLHAEDVHVATVDAVLAVLAPHGNNGSGSS